MESNAIPSSFLFFQLPIPKRSTATWQAARGSGTDICRHSGRYDGLEGRTWPLCAWFCQFFRLTVPESCPSKESWGPVLHPSLPVPFPIVRKPSVGTFSLCAWSFLRLACCCTSELVGSISWELGNLKAPGLCPMTVLLLSNNRSPIASGDPG